MTDTAMAQAVSSSADVVMEKGDLDDGPKTMASSPIGSPDVFAGAVELSLDDVEPVPVRIRDLAVSVDTAPSWREPSTYGELAAARFRTSPPRIKTLLSGVSADLAPGSLTAIIGGSGSGKTTLLNTLAERVASARLRRDGVAMFGGQADVKRVRHAYVMQQDILLPTLTVRETLRYSADLRLPPRTGLGSGSGSGAGAGTGPGSGKGMDDARDAIVEEVIRELGLKECADTRVGDGQHRGISGGEKRRVSIAVQLLANPSVLFLDEPTTGLDATSAYQLVLTLKALAQRGRTIITTIHQPRSEIWHLFDGLVVLARGSPVYSGSAAGCLPWFEGLGFQLPPFVNPAEFVIDVAAVDNRTPELEAETAARLERLKGAWAAESEKRFPPLDADTNTDTGMDMEMGSNTPAAAAAAFNTAQGRAGFWRQTRILTDRTLKVTYRDPLGMTASVLESLLMGAVVGYLFFMLAGDQAGIRSRQGLLYTVSGLQGYLVLMFETYRMVSDIPTFDRENAEGCVDAAPYVLSRRLARLPTEDVPVPLFFSALVYFMAGLERDAGKFFTFFAVSLLNHYCCLMCATTCVVAVRHFPGASLIANLAYTVQSVCCGIFLQVNTIPVYVRWLKWIAWNFYVFSAYCANEFQGSFYDCPEPGGRSDPACLPYTGEFIMSSLGMPTNWVARPIAVLVAFLAMFLAVSILGLHFVKAEMTIARARNSDTDLSAGKEKMTARSVAEVRAIDLELDSFALGLDKRTPWGKSLPRKQIVQPITATFRAGMLNVIMGPSGSGKTSLLNAMALRLRDSVGTKYRPSGRLTFNGAEPSDSVIKSVCSYVCQDDDGLLPSLTVRETLRFAAALRLPSFLGREEKRRRAEDVLLKLGLKDCADVLIGNDLVKGISGGEKRRVSIAVQVLTDPRVLLLDEPTSGLDAFTAGSIMQVLQGLADEGRTLILTIHQPRSDLFRHFGSVLLLARGGAPAFAGPAGQMLPYLARRGHECPQHSNPADFALDMITVDLQRDDREAETRRRVAALVEDWKRIVQGDDKAPWDGDGDVGQLPVDEKKKKKNRLDDDVQVEGPTRDGDDGQKKTVSHPRRSLDRANLSTPAELGALKRDAAPLAAALPLLLQRAVINARRQPPVIMARTMQVIGLAIIFALFWSPLHHDYYSVQNRMGFIQEVSAFYFVGMLQNVAVYPPERDVFYRESDDGVYGVRAFLLSYTLLEAPFEVFSALVFGVLMCLAIGIPRTAVVYFVCTFCCFAIISCGESLGIMFNTLVGHAGFAVNVMGMFVSLATTMAGVLSIHMPAPFRALNYLSPLRYLTRAIAPYTLRGVRFYCTPAQALADGECPITTGEQVLRLYGLDVDPVVNIAALAGCVVVYRLLAWAVLAAARARWGDLRPRRRG